MARNIFTEISQQRTPDTSLWNTMLLAYARRCMGKEAIDLFAQMIKNNVPVDAATFSNLLSACAHSEYAQECLQFYSQMESKYSIRFYHFNDI